MPRTRSFGIAAVVLCAALVLAACGSSGSPTIASHGSGKGKTLTVWAMQDDYSTKVLDAINSRFTKETGARVNIQIQEWTGIETKVPTALATSTPPDIIDIGSTQVSSYAASGGLANLTQDRKSLEQGRTWLPGLLDPALVKGQLYAVPGFAGDRAVIYNKKTWAAAGITAPPTTYSELTSDLDKIKAANPQSGFSAFYLPAEEWLVSQDWVFDAGGKIATRSKNGTWKGAFGSAADQKGLQEFKQFQNAYSSKASQLVDANTPDQNAVFADGQAAAIMATPGSLTTIEKDNPSMTSADLGVFTMPGLHHPKQTIFLGGSDWAVAAKSQNKSLAAAWIKIAASPQIEDQYVFGVDGWITNSYQGVSSAQKHVSTQLQPFFVAAKNSEATPPASKWNTLQNDNSIAQFYGAIASGSQTPAAAAKSFDGHIDSVLNGE